MKLFDAAHRPGFLWPAERNLMHHFMTLHQDAFAWNDTERGHFREDFSHPSKFLSYHISHGSLKIARYLPEYITNFANYFRKNSTLEYSRSHVLHTAAAGLQSVKKDGISLRIVQSLEPLNAVTIAHSGVTPFTDQIAEQFSALACAGLLDLFVGYDERALAESSRDYTTFQTPFGALRLTTLPMGWTNSVPIFHDDVTHILQPEIRT